MKVILVRCPLFLKNRGGSETSFRHAETTTKINLFDNLRAVGRGRVWKMEVSHRDSLMFYKPLLIKAGSMLKLSLVVLRSRKLIQGIAQW